jgi:alpha-tubulin suppressor-like RCC1 family protein
MTSGTVLANATAISSGEEHSCAIANTKLVCWGSNAAGQLGDDTLIDKLRAFINGL